MSYYVAVGSSDGLNVNLRFGDVDKFLIYSVEGTNFWLKEKRELSQNGLSKKLSEALSGCSACTSSICVPRDCAGERMLRGTAEEEFDDSQKSFQKDSLDSVLGSDAVQRAAGEVKKPQDCEGNGHGCDGPTEAIARVDLISDCRAVVCTKIGFQAQKQFERKAISVFDVSCPISEALDKITSYYDKVDRHQSLRREAV